MSKLTHVVNLVLGDWSGDGHSKTDFITIRSSLSPVALAKAYNMGCKIVGFDLSNEVASDYEDSRIRGEELKKLRAAGYTKELDDEYPENDSGNEEYDGTALLDSDTFAEIYLWVAQKGNPKLQYEVDRSRLDIGGYGLFCL